MSSSAAGGQWNVFRGNRLTVGADGVGINVYRADVSTGNVVACDNLVVDADLANVPAANPGAYPENYKITLRVSCITFSYNCP